MAQLTSFDVVLNGMALNTSGLTGNNTIAGLGLLTYGLIWPCSGIWEDYEEDVVTVWEECETVIDPNLEYCGH